jgi:hypothetical protein
MIYRLFPIPLALLVGACSHANKDGSGFDPNGDTLGVPGDGGSGTALSADGGIPAIKGCAEAAKLVYLVSAQNDLYSFNPDKLQFQRIGPLNCPTGAHPYSMGVDRTGTAWIDYDSGELFRVSTADASCTKTSYVPQNGFVNFGMGFASDAPGSESEALYVCGTSQGNRTGLGLGKLDTKTMQLTFLGDYSGTLHGDFAELTGTGDAKLFGFFEGNPALLAEIDKGSAATPSPVSLNGLQISAASGFAFSFWGGDFWFYTMEANDPGSHVTRYKAATDKSVSVVLTNVGFEIVGAGVSTCAPTSPLR